jgi:hypothetical protein
VEDWQPVIIALGALITACAGVVIAITPVLMVRLSGKVDKVQGLVDGTARAQLAEIVALKAEITATRAVVAGRRTTDSTPPGGGAVP